MTTTGNHYDRAEPHATYEPARALLDTRLVPGGMFHALTEDLDQDLHNVGWWLHKTQGGMDCLVYDEGDLVYCDRAALVLPGPEDLGAAGLAWRLCIRMETVPMHDWLFHVTDGGGCRMTLSEDHVAFYDPVYAAAIAESLGTPVGELDQRWVIPTLRGVTDDVVALARIAEFIAATDRIWESEGLIVPDGVLSSLELAPGWDDPTSERWDLHCPCSGCDIAPDGHKSHTVQFLHDLHDRERGDARQTVLDWWRHVLTR